VYTHGARYKLPHWIKQCWYHCMGMLKKVHWLVSSLGHLQTSIGMNKSSEIIKSTFIDGFSGGGSVTPPPPILVFTSPQTKCSPLQKNSTPPPILSILVHSNVRGAVGASWKVRRLRPRSSAWKPLECRPHWGLVTLCVASPAHPRKISGTTPVKNMKIHLCLHYYNFNCYMCSNSS
jgi:hypothetical protein